MSLIKKIEMIKKIEISNSFAKYVLNLFSSFSFEDC